MATLILKDELETINFLDGTNYELEDNSFIASYPSVDETFADSPFFSGRDLIRMNYGPRDMTFNTYVYGSTQKVLAENIMKIQRLLVRASTNPYLNGGSYAQDSEYTQGKDTGDQGVILQVRRGTDALGNITSEADNATEADAGLYSIRVIKGNLDMPENFFASADKKADGTFYRLITVNLYTEPFFVGPSRVIATSTGLNGGAVSPTNGNSNRIFISGSAIPGDVDALTRIGTEISGLGIVIARDAGISLLNSTTAPIFTGSGRKDMFAWGFRRNNTNYNMRVRILSGGASFEYSTNNGSSYTGSIAITANTPIQLGTLGVWVMFGAASGYTAGDYWSFRSHQAHFAAGTALNANNNQANLYSDYGISVYTLNLTVPPGCRSRYKVIGTVVADYACEYNMRVYYTSFTSTGADIATEPQRYEWTGPNGTGTSMLDLGIIDLTSVSNPQLSHPYAGSTLNIEINARTMQDVANPPGSDTIQITNCYLIPVQDEFGYLQAGWKADSSNTEVYSNYDPAFPYIAEENTNMFGQANVTAKHLTLLDSTYAGNIITLIPNVDQTIIMFPLQSPSTDWRTHTISTGSTGDTYIAIRPRYLYLPS